LNKHILPFKLHNKLIHFDNLLKALLTQELFYLMMSNCTLLLNLYIDYLLIDFGELQKSKIEKPYTLLNKNF